MLFRSGYGKYGITNSNAIGIEVCISGNKPFTKKDQARLEWLVKHLMKKHNIKAANVKRHYDASRKLCPLYYAKNEAAWKTLHKKITSTATTPKKDDALPYKVKVLVDDLKIREDAGTKHKIVGEVEKGVIYTIIEEKKPGSVKWGRLKSKKGWISLGSKYVKKV